MDHIRVLENAARITFRYRALWVLGILWALVGGQPLTSSGNGAQFTVSADDSERLRDLMAQPWLPWALVGACGLIVVLAVLVTAARYVLQAGTFRSLDAAERDGIVPTVRGALRQGWHRRTWRPFFQDLIVDVPFILVGVAGFIPAALPLAALAAEATFVKVLGVFAAVLLMLAWIALLFLAGAVIGVLKQFWWRAALLDEGDFLTAIGHGVAIVRRSPGDTAILWLLLFGVGLLYGLLSLGLLLGLGALTALVAGAPAVLLYRATDSVVPALLFGVPVGLVTFVLPALLLSGWILVFRAAVWNEAYRQLAPRLS